MRAVATFFAIGLVAMVAGQGPEGDGGDSAPAEVTVDHI